MATNNVTVVIDMPHGTQVIETTEAQLKDLDLPEGPGIEVRYIRDVPDAATNAAAPGPASEDAVVNEEPEPDEPLVKPKPEPKPELEGREGAVVRKRETRTEPRAAFGPVGPDPEQEAKRGVSVPKSPTGVRR